MKRFDGGVARYHINRVLDEKNLSLTNYYRVIDYLDDVTNQFKSTFNAEAENGTFDLAYNGFYFYQMLISCKLSLIHI